MILKDLPPDMAETRMGDGSGDGACGLGEIGWRGEEPWIGGGAGEERDDRGTGDWLGLLKIGLLDGVGGTGENRVDRGTGEG